MKHMLELIIDKLKKGEERLVTVKCSNCGTVKEMQYSSFRTAIKQGRAKCRKCYRMVHGESMTLTTEYVSWRNMRDRCHNPKYANYQHYGGRGIKVCDRWDENTGIGYKNFLADMGRKPSSDYTLDRIDPDGDYTPENCRWATAKEQAMNKKTTTIVEWNGERDSITGWAKRLDMVVPAVKYNYEHGLPLDTRRHVQRDKKYKGKTITEWGKELDVRYGALRLFMANHDWDIDKAIAYYTSPSRRKYPWNNLPSKGAI